MTTVETLPLNGWSLNRLNGDRDVSWDTVQSFVDVLDAVDLPVVVIHGDVTVAGFNQAAVNVLGFVPSHIGLSLGSLPAFGGITNLKASCEDVITGAPACRLDFPIGDKAFVVRIARCGNIGQPAAGAVLTFANVTAFRASIDQAIYEREFTKGILNTVAEPLVVLGPDARIRSGNRAFHAAFRMSRDRSQDVSIYELAEGAFDVVPLRAQLSAALAGIGTFEPIEVNYNSPNAGPRTVVLDSRPLVVPGQPSRWVLLTLQDITVRKQAEDVLRRNEAWLSAQTEAFQEAMNDAPLAASLDILIRAAIEHAGDQRRCAFYIADDKGGLRHVVGMPPSYARAVDGCAIGPESLACGLAIGSGRPVITPDVREERRWKPWLSLAEEYDYRGCWLFPVEAAAGKVVGSFAMYFKEPRDAMPRDRELAASLTHAAAIIISRHQEAEDRARVGKQFETLLNQSPLGVYLVNSEFRLCEANPIARSVFGEIPDLIGRDFEEVIHILWPKPDADDVVRHFRDTLETGEPYQEAEWIRRRLDRNVTEYYEWRIDRIQLTAGSFGVVCYFQDISDHIAARERLRLLIDELNHRVKNTLAAVQSIAMQTLRDAPTAAEGREALQARLLALASAHDVLTRRHWEGADIYEVIQGSLAAYRPNGQASRLYVGGPNIHLLPRAALALSMALHELATNAAKYGALSNGSGRVDVDWKISADPRAFSFRWAESGGPPVQTPRKRGFGSRLIERGLAQDFDGNIRLEFAAAGVICTIAAPIDEIGKEGVGAPHE